MWITCGPCQLLRIAKEFCGHGDAHFLIRRMQRAKVVKKNIKNFQGG